MPDQSLIDDFFTLGYVVIDLGLEDRLTALSMTHLPCILPRLMDTIIMAHGYKMPGISPVL